MARTTSPWSIRRKSVERRLVLHDEYLIETGKVILLWNELQSEYQIFFGKMFRNSNEEAAAAIWQTISSDQMQRDVFDAAATTILTKGIEKRALKNLKWALKETRKLAPYRNIAAHMPVQNDYDSKNLATVPNVALAKKQAAKVMTALGYKRLFKLLVGDLHLLAAYIRAHGTVLYGISPGLFPRRPRLSVYITCQTALKAKATT